MIFSTYPKGVRVRRKNHGPTIGRNPDARAKARLAKQRERIAHNRYERDIRRNGLAVDGVGLSRRGNLIGTHDV